MQHLQQKLYIFFTVLGVIEVFLASTKKATGDAYFSSVRK